MESVYSFASFACGVAVLVVGFAHLFKHVLGHRWCEGACVGPYLFWDDNDFFHDSNVRFRHTFSLMPKPLGENFGVLFLALMTLRTHFTHSQQFMTSFRQNASWLLIVALFGAFPFAGGLGIVVGFLCVATAAFGLVCHFTNSEGAATLNLTVDSSRSIDDVGGSCKFPGWFFRFWNVLMVGVLSLTVLNNVIHIFRNEFHHWCESNNEDDCVGPFLIWPGDFLRSVNADKFGSVFSLDINRGLELWTPALLVMLYLAFGMESWLGSGFFLVFLGVFGAFGYTGNMGVIIGMMLCVCGITSFFVGLLGGREAQAPIGGGYRYARDGAGSLL